MRSDRGQVQLLGRTTVYDEPGRFAGWPANYGMWAFGDEVVLVFLLGHTGPLRGVHARDLSRPFVPVVARSHDRGRTWATEEFVGVVPGARVLSGDEHQDPWLQAGPHITDSDFVALTSPIDFTDRETLVMAARTHLGAGSRSWYYVSRNRGHHWDGPHALPDFGQTGLAARTDIVPLGAHEALWMLTAAKEDGAEGRVFAAQTTDGGLTFTRHGWLDPAPPGLQIMPSSVLTQDGTVLTAVRAHKPATADLPARFQVELYASTDCGGSWNPLGTPVNDTGPAGNPPVLLSLGDAGLLCIYGYRGDGAGLRYVTGNPTGTSWSDPVVVTDDSPMGDIGYPRAVQLNDGTILCCTYNNRGDESERFIEAVIWRP